VSESTEPRTLALLPARDMVAALAAAGGDAELAEELLSTLLEGLPGEIAGMRAAAADSDWPTLADLAHQTRGATRYCGVPALDEAVEALERSARSGAAGSIPAQLAQVEWEASRLAAEAG
jgi:HPt (histidine-containing phosphotransfer) domain-containing protein